jgi:S-DNA-T family DNA segregation ATPase FtsK/SpoIIIE
LPAGFPTRPNAEPAAGEDRGPPGGIALADPDRRRQLSRALLWGYNPDDPGLVARRLHDTLHNPAGRSGAWLADLMLYIFGLSAWWWIVLLLVFVWWGYRRLDGQHAGDRRPLYIALAGFLVLIVASSGLETLRFYTLKAPLPVGPGGIIGIELAPSPSAISVTRARRWRCPPCSRSAGASSPACPGSPPPKGIGALFERAVLAVAPLFERWQDRRIGREVAREREAVVEVEKKRVDP